MTAKLIPVGDWSAALAIPARFLVQPEAPPPRPDKRAIAEAIKSDPVPWAHLQKSTRLDIR